MSLDAFESIFQQFPATTAKDWKDKIIKDLKGESFDKLIWHTKEGIEVLPFYTKEDIENCQLKIPAKQTNGWHITERINVEEISLANKEALHALKFGATSIVFNLQSRVLSTTDIENLLEDILLDIAPVTFENYTESNKPALEAIVKDSCAAMLKIPQQETIADELVYALKHGIHNKANQFHFLTGQNYFFEIAKLRAFRFLWKKAADLNNLPDNLFIQCETRVEDFNQENSNILRNTTAAMSAILGGCDSLIVSSHDADNTAFGKRIARNIQHILVHESNFDEWQDAAKGSYYLEYLTYHLSKNAWEKFSASVLSDR